MSFFDNTEPATGSMEMGGGDFEPIPANTQVLAYIEDAKIDEYEGDEKVKITWVVLQPEEFKDRKVFQNVKVFDQKPEVSAKARKMLMAIDFNAGGKLLASGQAPDDMNLMTALGMKQMVLKLAVWDMNDKKGNWVTSVGAKGSAVPKAAPAPVSAPTTGADDEVPF
jgi:hypothetical protein